jgi:hypothetical protein
MLILIHSEGWIGTLVRNTRSFLHHQLGFPTLIWQWFRLNDDSMLIVRSPSSLRYRMSLNVVLSEISHSSSLCW